LEQPDDAAGSLDRRLGRPSPRWKPGWGIPEGKPGRDRWTVTTPNAARGEDPDFHKAAGISCAARQRPHGERSTCRWARRCMQGSPSAGLATSVNGQVLRRRRHGLSAACMRWVRGASNIAQDGKGYASGTQLGEGSFFLRAAAPERTRAPRRPGARRARRRVGA